MSTAATYHSLRDAFAMVFDDAAKDPIEHILALTYEFDDQQLLNLLAGRPLDEKFEPRVLDLRQISALAPVVIYDARKTKSANLVPHFMELLPVKMPAYSCHHSKAYLVATRDHVHLLLGSMNLTHSGLFSNREVFRDFCCSAARTEDLRLMRDFLDLVGAGYEATASMGAVIEGVRAKLRRWAPAQAHAPTPADVHLLSSGYEGQAPGLAQLAALWRKRFGDVAPEAVFAVSPFFDRGTGGQVLVSLLRRTLGDFEHLKIVTDASCLPALSLRHFDEIPGAVHCIGEKISPKERRHIEQANDGISAADLLLRRKLHAKILVLQREDACLAYTGSANFTCKAWDGTNRELGVAWFEDHATRLCDQVVQRLHATLEDRFAELPPAPAAEASDDEDYEELLGYPDFVDTIALRASGAEDEFVFEISGSSLEQLDRYDIEWGRERLRFVDGVSSALSANTLFARLLGGRNLRFTPRALATTSYFLPFRHAPALFAQRDVHLHPSAEDWMLLHLGIDEGVIVETDEFVPGEERPQEGEAPPRAEVDRDQNVVVRMQRYLSLFSRIETEFHERGHLVAQLAVQEQGQQWQSTVSAPLLTLSAVLSRQPTQALLSHDQERLFQIGELVLLARSLETRFQKDASLSDAIASRLPASVDDPLQADYLHFCRHFS